MPPTPDELRERSRVFRDAAQKAAIPELKRRLAHYALLLAFAAEAIERGGPGRDDVLPALGDQERLIAEALAGAPVSPPPGERKTVPGVRDQIKQWRLRAEELRTTADHFEVPSAQESLRRAADDYDKLADDAEAALTGRPPVTDETVS
jgi:hypothetical protein